MFHVKHWLQNPTRRIAFDDPPGEAYLRAHA
jgi:hypothetical protein